MTSDNTQPGVSIARIEIENAKRVKAFYMSPARSGLTVIGGKNGQGKTSILDSLAWAVGGGRKAPSNPHRDGSMSPPSIKVELSNGLVAERKGAKSALTVTDPTGKRGGQALLDAFVSEFALDLPKFLDSNAKDKAKILLQILGIGDELGRLEQEEARIYNERHAIGQIYDSKRKHADELPEFPDVPSEPVSVSDLIQAQQEILARNGENQRKRENLASLEGKLKAATDKVLALQVQLDEAVAHEALCAVDVETAKKSAANLQDESTAELEAQIENFESMNAQISANLQKQAAKDEAAQYGAQRDEKEQAIDAVRRERLALLDSAPLPLPGLTVEDAELRYNGQAWDGMSSSEQLRVAVAIVRQLQPNCSFVLMDKLEQMDLDTLTEFGAWLEAEGLQVIATRVSTGEECTIVIEDGLPAGKTMMDVVSVDAAPVETETEEW